LRIHDKDREVAVTLCLFAPTRELTQPILVSASSLMVESFDRGFDHPSGPVGRTRPSLLRRNLGRCATFHRDEVEHVHSFVWSRNEALQVGQPFGVGQLDLDILVGKTPFETFAAECACRGRCGDCTGAATRSGARDGGHDH